MITWRLQRIALVLTLLFASACPGNDGAGDAGTDAGDAGVGVDAGAAFGTCSGGCDTVDDCGPCASSLGGTVGLIPCGYVECQNNACVPIYGGCTTNADCTGGRVCNSWCSCVEQTPPCSAPLIDGQCGLTGFCVSCNVDADCPSTMVCRPDGSCVFGSGCFADADCVPPDLCDPLTARCGQPCDTDLDCPNTQKCPGPNGVCYSVYCPCPSGWDDVPGSLACTEQR